MELIARFLRSERPDILCLQELKSPADKIACSAFAEMGYDQAVLRGQKAYNGVAVFSRIPITDMGSKDMLGNGSARHVAVQLDNGIIIENFYVPAGGYEPDPATNPKFGEKLDYVRAMRDWSRQEQPTRKILVGDLNIAPQEDDVWSHRQLLNVVSHTPAEVDLLNSVIEGGNWTDIVRADIPHGKLYSWWSYRSPDWDAADKGRRLDHIWATPDLVRDDHCSRILRSVRGWERPSDHVPVIAEFDL